MTVNRRVRKRYELLLSLISPCWCGFSLHVSCHFHVCHTAFWRHVPTHIHHHRYTVGALYEATSLSNIQRVVSPTPADTDKHSPVYYCLSLPCLLACGIRGAVTTASPRDHSEIMQPPSPASAPRQLLLSSLQTVCKSLCEFNLPPDFTVLPFSWRLHGLKNARSKRTKCIGKTAGLVCGLKPRFKFGNE